MPMPEQKPGRSKQDYGTPKEFLDAVKKRLHITDFSVDLAADEHNRVCQAYFDKDFDALRDDVTWNHHDGRWAWCNPPYGKIEPWVEKAATESMKGAHIAMLIPASVGANWWRTWVESYAYQSYLNGRIQFVGATDLYPKDCALLLYTPWGFTGHEIWNWRGYVN